MLLSCQSCRPWAQVYFNPPESPNDFRAVTPVTLWLPETGMITDVAVDDVDSDGVPDMVCPQVIRHTTRMPTAHGSMLRTTA